MTYVQITSTVPCLPQNATDHWAAFKDYEESSLGGDPEGSRADRPDCSLLDENGEHLPMSQHLKYGVMLRKW